MILLHKLCYLSKLVPLFTKWNIMLQLLPPLLLWLLMKMMLLLNKPLLKE
jgi:hypothetical protein